MGKLKIIQSSPLATIQDKGRFGYRQFGIPQSGAMDVESMKAANGLIGNPETHPIIEFALGGMKLEILEETSIGISGALFKVNGKASEYAIAKLTKVDTLEITAPFSMFAYLSIGGLIKARNDFGSYSTYEPAGFGGLQGKRLQKGDILETENSPVIHGHLTHPKSASKEEIATIRIMKGPEWNLLKELPENKTFIIDPSSNRMGIRLSGEMLQCDGSEILSSAVIPGTIQLPANGQPIILMNDCQTTGGYPRIGKVVEEDMGKLAQLPHMKKVEFVVV